MRRLPLDCTINFQRSIKRGNLKRLERLLLISKLNHKGGAYEKRVPYTAMEFSVGLDAVTAGSYYKLTLYMSDKKNNSSVKYWDADTSSYVVATTETDNDADDLRIHEIIISNVTVNTTLPLQIAGERTNSGFPVVLGGMELVLVGSLLPPPEEGGMLAGRTCSA